VRYIPFLPQRLKPVPWPRHVSLEIEDSPKMKPNNWDEEIEFFDDSVVAVAVDGLQFLKLNYS
jgi:hypothetical protein